jgi:hypothetical protein
MKQALQQGFTSRSRWLLQILGVSTRLSAIVIPRDISRQIKTANPNNSLVIQHITDNGHCLLKCFSGRICTMVVQFSHSL